MLATNHATYCTAIPEFAGLSQAKNRGSLTVPAA